MMVSHGSLVGRNSDRIINAKQTQDCVAAVHYNQNDYLQNSEGRKA